MEERNSGNENTRRRGRMRGVEEGWGGGNVRIRRGGEREGRKEEAGEGGQGGKRKVEMMRGR